MSLNNDETPVREMTKLLDQERAALLDGDYAAVTALAEEKKRLAVEIERAHESGALPAKKKTDKAALLKLQAALTRNAMLIDGAREGFAHARRRIETISRRSGEVGVYDESGERPKLGRASRAGGRTA